jgi:hypothetical protein
MQLRRPESPQESIAGQDWANGAIYSARDMHSSEEYRSPRATSYNTDFHDLHVERNAGLVKVSKTLRSWRPSLSPHPLVPPPPRRYGWLRIKSSTLTGQIADTARQSCLLQR